MLPSQEMLPSELIFSGLTAALQACSRWTAARNTRIMGLGAAGAAEAVAAGVEGLAVAVAAAAVVAARE